MPLINTSVPNLIQGVSQQADASRFAGQCEEQENALSSVADGLKKRPNTRHVGMLLGNAISANSFVHFINRSESEKYVIIHDGTNLRAFDMLTGDSVNINESSAFSVNGTYLDTATPLASLKALTIADSTLILNSAKEVGLSSATSPSLAKEAIVFIKQGDYQKKYGFDVVATTSSGNSAEITFTSATDGSYFKINSFSLTSGGTGFAVGDIVDIPLPTSKTINYTDDGGSEASHNFPLTLLTQPTFKVLTVNSNGVITSIEIENQGRFRYQGQVTDADGTTGFDRFGTGTNFDENGTRNKAEVFSIASTGSTEVSGGSVTLNKTFISGAASSSDATLVDSSVILTGVADLTNTTGTGHSGSGNTWTTHFETDVTKLDSNVLVLKAKSGVVDFSITPKDGLSGNGIGIIYKEVGSISDLPLVCKNGFEVKVAGDAELNQDDYYVRFETTGGEAIGTGSWVECVAPELSLGYDSNTLPIELVSGLNGFTFRTMKFADRIAGDDNSNPLASFVAQRIDNLFFFKNRLGFLSGENIIMSESGLGVLDSTGQLVYNFGRTTVTTLLDSDPIDVAVASSRVTNLKSAKGFQENLVLFSETGQFVLKGGDVLTPKTVSITPITNFNFEDQVDPLPLGSYIYFPFTRGNFTGLREFTVNASTDNYDSTEITEHVPAYIPKNIVDMAGTTTEDTLVLLSGDEKSSLYVYNYFWNNNQKVLSAWSKYTFTDEIRGIEFIDSRLYMITTDDQSNTHLVFLPFESGLKETDHTGAPADFVTLLDNRVPVRVTSGSDVVEFATTAGFWEILLNTTAYSGANADLPYTFFDGSIPSGGQSLPQVFVDSTGTTYSLKYLNAGSGGQVFLTSGTAPSTLYGYVGLPYTMKYRFSTQVFKASSGQSASPTNASSMHLRNGTLFFNDTNSFDVKVTPEHRSTVTNSFTANDVPEAEQVGAIKIAEGNFRFPVYSKAKHADILIENSGPFDSKFNAAEFESFVHPRSSRYG